jgi:hypothetical protein
MKVHGILFFLIVELAVLGFCVTKCGNSLKQNINHIWDDALQRQEHVLIKRVANINPSTSVEYGW